LLGEHGIQKDSAAGRQQFEQRMELRRREENDSQEFKPLERGWYLGSQQFRAELLERMESQLKEHHSAGCRLRQRRQFLPAPFKTKGHLDFPQIVTGGVPFRPTTNWNIEVDIDWTDWDTVKTAPIDRVGALQLHWQSSFLY